MSVNTFSGVVLFENRQFFRNFLECSKCSSSLNFEHEINLTPFLESLKALLSNAYVDREILYF